MLLNKPKPVYPAKVVGTYRVVRYPLPERQGTIYYPCHSRSLRRSARWSVTRTRKGSRKWAYCIQKNRLITSSRGGRKSILKS